MMCCLMVTISACSVTQYYEIMFGQGEVIEINVDLNKDDWKKLVDNACASSETSINWKVT